MDATATTLASNVVTAPRLLTSFDVDAYEQVVASLPDLPIRECAQLATGAEQIGEQAKRLSALAYRECGKKLLAIPPARGKRDVTSRTQAAIDAGMTERERKTAPSIGGLPEHIFCKIVEAPDLTINKLLDAAKMIAKSSSLETPRPATKTEPKVPHPMESLMRAWNGADKKTRDDFYKMMSIGRASADVVLT